MNPSPDRFAMADTKLKRIQLSATGFRKMPLVIGARINHFTNNRLSQFLVKTK
jgi:hypothetical protein